MSLCNFQKQKEIIMKLSIFFIIYIYLFINLEANVEMAFASLAQDYYLDSCKEGIT